MSYYKEERGDLYYATKDQGGWRHSHIDIIGDVGRASSIAVDSNGFAHVSYIDSSNKTLRYAYQDAGGWHLIVVPAQGTIDNYTAIVLDSDDNVHIAYHTHSGSDYSLMYAYNQDVNWNFEQIEGVIEGNAPFVYDAISISIDSGDNPIVAYTGRKATMGGPGYSLRYARRSEEGWAVEFAEHLGGGYVTLTVDSADSPHVVYSSGRTDYVGPDLSLIHI